MRIFMTGATGYVGSYVVHELLQCSSAPLYLLIRANNREEALLKLWRGLQLHQDETTFAHYVPRLRIVLGDLSLDNLGIAKERYSELIKETNSVLHVGASLNRRSEKSCLNVNLRGTLSVLKLARELADKGQLRRFSHVSTVAVAGKRFCEVVTENESIEWSRSDYDPYARTKKFCEHMARELLPSDRIQFLRPSIVMGDSRFPQTTQFDMVRAFCALSELSAIPLAPHSRLDIVNADFVGKAIAQLHTAEKTQYDTYHLSSGRDSVTALQIAETMAHVLHRRRAWFFPALEKTFSRSIELGTRFPHDAKLYKLAALLKVFWPYIRYDTVFDNTRVTTELGIAPVPFTHYCAELYRYAKAQHFHYPYRPLPELHSEAA